MNNAELITELTYCASIEKRKLLSDAADALEAAEKRIDELEKSYSWKAYAALEESIEGYKTRIAELEAQIPKEGEWIQKDSWYYCSNCGHDMFFTGTYDEEQRYCYYCGARMRKGAER